MPLLVDSHCHLDFPDFANDFADIMARARDNQVGHMVTIGTYLSRSDIYVDLARRYENVSCTIGVHPHQAGIEGITDQTALDPWLGQPGVIGIGETGLDYFYDHSPREIQQQSFKNHLLAAIHHQLPIVVHTRDAEADTMALMDEARQHGHLTGLLHCFSGSRDLAEWALDRGLYLSFSGIVTFRKSTELQAIARDAPLGRILVETDAPYLAPMPHRGKRNEPGFVRHTAEFLAQLRGEDFLVFARATTDNFKTLFPRARMVA
jgi:TatD DNase family protein